MSSSSEQQQHFVQKTSVDHKITHSITSGESAQKKYAKKTKLSVPVRHQSSVLSSHGFSAPASIAIVADAINCDSPKKCAPSIVVSGWRDLSFRFYERNDEMAIHFVPGRGQDVEDEEDLFPTHDVVGALGPDEKLVYLSFQKFDKNKGFHVFDYHGFVDDLPPMNLQCRYDAESDVLNIDFVEQEVFRKCFYRNQESSTRGYIIHIALNKDQKIIGLEILDASKWIRNS